MKLLGYGSPQWQFMLIKDVAGYLIIQIKIKKVPKEFDTTNL